MPESENQLYTEYREFCNQRENEKKRKVTVRSKLETDPVSFFIRRNFTDMSKAAKPVRKQPVAQLFSH